MMTLALLSCRLRTKKTGQHIVMYPRQLLTKEDEAMGAQVRAPGDAEHRFRFDPR
jgi:hypothetical protein